MCRIIPHDICGIIQPGICRFIVQCQTGCQWVHPVLYPTASYKVPVEISCKGTQQGIFGLIPQGILQKTLNVSDNISCSIPHPTMYTAIYAFVKHDTHRMDRNYQTIPIPKSIKQQQLYKKHVSRTQPQMTQGQKFKYPAKMLSSTLPFGQ